MKKFKSSNYAVSEVVGTVFILGISISLFSTVYVTLFSMESPTAAPIVDIVGMTPDDQHIVFSHIGGDKLSIDSLVIVDIGGKEITYTLGDLLDESSKEDGFWNIGEELVINYDFRGLQVEGRIVDKKSNSIVMMGILQEGDIIRDPYCFTINATDIQADSAKLIMGYNFWTGSGEVRFAYRKSGGSWLYTSWIAKSGESNYEENIGGLLSSTLYEYKAQCKWAANSSEGGEKSFSTSIPTVATLAATDIKTNSAKLWMQYDFKGLSGSVSFSYKLSSSSSWVDTAWIAVSGQGSYGEIISGLTEELTYEFKARLDYTSNIIEGVQKSFKTWSIIMGKWNFSEGTGSTAFDASEHGNHGTIVGADWTIGVDTTGLSFDGIDDYIRVFDSVSLDVTEDITVEAWVKSLENSNGTIGDITATLDYSNFGSDYGLDSDLIQLKDEYFAIAFRGDDNDGFIATAIIDNFGTIRKIIDYYEFELTYCVEPDIIHIANDYYAIVYEGPDFDGFIKTVKIDVLGQITDNVFDTLEYDTSEGKNPNIIHVDGDVYAIAYVGWGGNGYVKTVNIWNNGLIDNSVIDTTIFMDTESGTQLAEPKIIQVDNNIYAIVYRNPDDDGEVRTITILNNGWFFSPAKSDGSYWDKFTFDQYDSWRPTSLVNINTNVYACCYRGRDGKGAVLTLRIFNTGIIADDIIDKYYFESTACYEPEMAYIANDYYAIAYRGVDDDGFLKIVEIYSDGIINKSVIDSYEFETYDCYKPTIHYYTGDIFIIAYTRDNEGILITVKMPSNGDISSASPIIHKSRYTLFIFIEPDIIHVNGEIYAVACRGLESDGYIRTFQISDSGIINDNVIDCLEFDYYDGYQPKIIHISNNIYAIVYRGTSNHGFVKTVQIENTGEIVGVKDTLEYDASAGYDPDIIHVGADYYAIAYRGSGNDGFVTTVQILPSGDIDNCVKDTLEFDTSYCFEPDMIHINGAIFAIAYRGPGDDGFIKTLQIFSNGDIQNTPIDSYEYNPSCGWTPDIINIYDTVYAIAFSYLTNGGYISTIEIADNGIITKSVIDSFRFDNNVPSGDLHCYNPHIIHIDGRVYAIAYRGQNNGYVKTLRIGITGDITNANDDYISGSAGWDLQIIHLDGGNYAVPYRGSTYNAYISTIEIKLAPVIRNVVYKSSAYGLKANSTTIFGHINGKIISAPLSAGFNHVVLTYNRSLSSNQMKLFVNGVLKTEDTYSSLINSNNNDLIMGQYNCVLDEVTIWNVPLDDATILEIYNDLKP